MERGQVEPDRLVRREPVALARRDRERVAVLALGEPGLEDGAARAEDVPEPDRGVSRVERDALTEKLRRAVDRFRRRGFARGDEDEVAGKHAGEGGGFDDVVRAEHVDLGGTERVDLAYRRVLHGREVDHEVGAQAPHRLVDERRVRDVEVGKIGEVGLGAELVQVFGDAAPEESVRAGDEYALTLDEVGRELESVLRARQEVGVSAGDALGEYLGEVV